MFFSQPTGRQLRADTISSGLWVLARSLQRKKAQYVWIPCNSFSEWLLRLFCGCCPTLHRRALISHELLICSLPCLLSRAAWHETWQSCESAVPRSALLCARLPDIAGWPPAGRLTGQGLGAQRGSPAQCPFTSEPSQSFPWPEVSSAVIRMACH